MRQKPDSGLNKNLKMAKMGPAVADTTNRKTLSAEGKKRSAFEKSKSSAGSQGPAARSKTSNVGKPAMTQDAPDFTVLDVKQEEFEQVSDQNKFQLF